MTGHIVLTHMASWQAQDAKARFSELLDATVEKGPQVITRRNVETAVIVPIAQWRQLQSLARPGLKALLLEPEARLTLQIPKRGGKRRRDLPELP